MKPRPDTDFDVLIIGAGPAGLGVAVPLQACGIHRIAILEARTIGASFDHWPRQMRLITPSFLSNPFRQPDLNAITPDTSPADFLRSEHPTGPEYASYLRAVARHHQLPVREGTRVQTILPEQPVFAGADGKRFVVETGEGHLTARFLVWAAGEFFYPLEADFEGAGHCLHNTKVQDWNRLEGDAFAVIGGYESGIDAAIHLLRRGKTVHLFSRGEPWNEDSPDPSNALSPFTRDRLREAVSSFGESLHLHPHSDIVQVLAVRDGWVLTDRDNLTFRISARPILATGFRGSLAPVLRHFEIRNGNPVFSEEADESTLVPGLFYSGPLLQHRGTKFCFIYKFRSRFGVIARSLARRLGGDESALQAFADRGFLNEDLSCCTDCRCAVPRSAAAPRTPARAEHDGSFPLEPR